MENDLDKKLHGIKVKALSDQERDQMWQRVYASIKEPAPTYNFFLFLIHKPVVQVVFVIVLLFGGSVATVAAADHAKPGDFLFPLDRRVENVRITLASDKKKDELKVKFAFERAKEIEEILLGGSDDGSMVSSSPTSTTPTTTDNSSQDQSSQQERIEQAFAVAIDYIATVKQELEENGNMEAVAAIDHVIDRLDSSIDTLPAKVKLEVKREKNKHNIELKIKTSDGEQKATFESEGNKSEYESEGPDGKLKIKMEDDGRVIIEREDGDSDKEIRNDEDTDGDDLLDDSDDKDDDQGLSEIKAKVFTDQTTIKVEYNDHKHSITASSTDREDIIDTVVNQFDVDREDVGRILRITYEDHASDTDSKGASDEGDEDSESNVLDDSTADNSSLNTSEHNSSNSSDTSDDESPDDTDISNDIDHSQTTNTDEDTGNNDNTSTQSQDLREAEAEVEGGLTKVKVKIGEQEDEYFLTITDRDGVIDDIVSRYGLDRSIVDQKLTFKVKSLTNRESE